jgi:hypothetical protein
MQKCMLSSFLSWDVQEFSTIDPSYISLLPTKLAECCEFVGTVGGLGVHSSMVDAFSNLTTKQILFGTFCKLINELQHIRYSKMHLSYLDSLIYWDPDQMVFGQDREPMPFF